MPEELNSSESRRFSVQLRLFSVLLPLMPLMPLMPLEALAIGLRRTVGEAQLNCNCAFGPLRGERRKCARILLCSRAPAFSERRQ